MCTHVLEPGRKIDGRKGLVKILYKNKSNQNVTRLTYNDVWQKGKNVSGDWLFSYRSYFIVTVRVIPKNVTHSRLKCTWIFFFSFPIMQYKVWMQRTIIFLSFLSCCCPLFGKKNCSKEKVPKVKIKWVKVRQSQRRETETTSNCTGRLQK